MALIRFAEGQQRSGSLGASVYSHNAFGQYIRSRSIPVNPRSDLQNEIRAAMLQAQARWAAIAAVDGVLPWEEYAEAVSWKNRLGDTVKLTGQQHFLRIASALAYHGRPISALTAPTDLRLPAPDETVTMTQETGSDEVSIAFGSAADDWKAVTGAYLLVYNGRELGPARRYYGGPFRKLAVIAGQAAPNPVSPQTAANRWGEAENVANRYAAYIRTYIPAIGLSEPRYLNISVTAP